MASDTASWLRDCDSLYILRATAIMSSVYLIQSASVTGATRPFSQLMRGVFFPNSNLLFTVQTRDPAAPAPKPTPEQQSQGFSVFDWGQGIYGGWQMIDNAAIAIADAGPLMLVPGIRCENGRVAPVNEPEWIKYTEDMIAVARKMYKLSQSRNQEAVSDATGDLSDSCAACHQAYREVRTRGRALDPTDPSNKASRCLSRASR